jgi:signal transduction histidine kinase
VLLYRQELRALGDAAGRVGRRAAPVVHQRVRDAAAGQRHRRLVGGAHAPEPARGAGGEQPPDAGARRADHAADAGDRFAPRTDAELQRAKAAADAANQAKSRYISTLSHELRTPLNSVIGYAQLLDDDPALPAHRRQAVSVIRRGGEHLLSLIEGTLDLARIESGKVSLAMTTMHFREAIDQLADLFELQAGAKGLRFRREFDAACRNGCAPTSAACARS